MPEWINSSPGVLSYGSSGVIVRRRTSPTKGWDACSPDGETWQVITQRTAKMIAEQAYQDHRAVGLVQPEPADD